MRFLTNRAIAVKRIETLYNLKQESFVGKHQTTIYKLIISSPPYRQAEIDYHTEALLKWGLNDAATKALIENHASLPKWIPVYSILHHLQIIHKAIPTSKKLSEIASHAKQR